MKWHDVRLKCGTLLLPLYKIHFTRYIFFLCFLCMFKKYSSWRRICHNIIRPYKKKFHLISETLLSQESTPNVTLHHLPDMHNKTGPKQWHRIRMHIDEFDDSVVMFGFFSRNF